MPFELSLPSAWSNLYQQVVTEFLLCTRDLSFQQDKVSILRKLSNTGRTQQTKVCWWCGRTRAKNNEYQVFKEAFQRWPDKGALKPLEKQSSELGEEITLQGCRNCKHNAVEILAHGGVAEGKQA